MSEVNEYKRNLVSKAWLGGSIAPLSKDGRCVIYADGKKDCVAVDDYAHWQTLWQDKFTHGSAPQIDIAGNYRATLAMEKSFALHKKWKTAKLFEGQEIHFVTPKDVALYLGAPENSIFSGGECYVAGIAFNVYLEALKEALIDSRGMIGLVAVFAGIAMLQSIFSNKQSRVAESQKGIPYEYEEFKAIVEHNIKEYNKTIATAAKANISQGARGDDPKVLANIKFIMERAVTKYDERNFTAAYDLCRQVVFVDSKNIQALNLLGKIEVERQNINEAYKWFDSVIAIDPQNKSANEGIARLDEEVANAWRQYDLEEARHADSYNWFERGLRSVAGHLDSWF